jgi:hypothetical protein
MWNGDNGLKILLRYFKLKRKENLTFWKLSICFTNNCKFEILVQILINGRVQLSKVPLKKYIGANWKIKTGYYFFLFKQKPQNSHFYLGKQISWPQPTWELHVIRNSTGFLMVYWKQSRTLIAWWPYIRNLFTIMGITRHGTCQSLKAHPSKIADCSPDVT